MGGSPRFSTRNIGGDSSPRSGSMGRADNGGGRESESKLGARQPHSPRMRALEEAQKQLFLGIHGEDKQKPITLDDIERQINKGLSIEQPGGEQRRCHTHKVGQASLRHYTQGLATATAFGSRTSPTSHASHINCNLQCKTLPLQIQRNGFCVQW